MAGCIGIRTGDGGSGVFAGWVQELSVSPTDGLSEQRTDGQRDYLIEMEVASDNQSHLIVMVWRK